MRRLVRVLLLCAACTPKPSANVTAPGAPPADPVEVYDALEAAIGEGRDDEQQRVDALAKVEHTKDDGSAAYAFVRAALLGRVAELRGADAGKLVTEAEAWARRSLQRDPEFRERAATQMLGSLYVMAPARLLEHGDSEDGLAMLEGLVEAKPAEPRYHFGWRRPTCTWATTTPRGRSCVRCCRRRRSCGATSASCSTVWSATRAAAGAGVRRAVFAAARARPRRASAWSRCRGWGSRARRAW
ncbi:MAG: hypothetical protein U0168_13160 [Nannocystaceae bacterium]